MGRRERLRSAAGGDRRGLTASASQPAALSLHLWKWRRRRRRRRGKYGKGRRALLLLRPSLSVAVLSMWRGGGGGGRRQRLPSPFSSVCEFTSCLFSLSLCQSFFSTPSSFFFPLPHSFPLSFRHSGRGGERRGRSNTVRLRWKRNGEGEALAKTT